MACQFCIGKQRALVKLLCKKSEGLLCRKARQRLARLEKQ